MFRQSLNGVRVFDPCSNWLHAAQKLFRPYLPKIAYGCLAQLYNLSVGAYRVGLGAYFAMQRLSTSPIDDLAAQAFSLPMLKHPVWLRPGTPDFHEVLHTVIRANYGRWLPPEPVRLIIDAGAYIGETTVWYLSRFPGATVIAL